MSIPKQSCSLDRFCQYLSVADSKQKWLTDTNLKRNFEKYQQNHSEFAVWCQQQDDNAIALFWREMALNDSPSRQAGEPVDRQRLALQHLSAFLQKACYGAAINIYSHYKNCLSLDNTLSSCFQISVELTCHNNPKFRQFLTNYNPVKARLETYCRGFLRNSLREKLNIGRISDERLLEKAREKKLRKALQDFGEQEPLISRIVFAHQFFQEIYRYKLRDPDRSQNQRYPKIDPEDYIETANYYNANLKLEMAPRLVFYSQEEITNKNVKTWLKLAIEALRKMEEKMDANTLEYDLNTLEHQEINSETKEMEKDSPEDHQCMYRQQIDRAQTEVLRLIESKKIPKSHLAIPFLHYGFKFSQEQVAERCAIVQENVSRHLSSYYKDPLHKKLKQDAQAHDVSQYISNWLFKGLTLKELTKTIDKSLDLYYKKMSLQEKIILKLYDRSLSSLQQVALEISCTEAEILEKLEKLKDDLETIFREALQRIVKSEIKREFRQIYQKKISQILIDIFACLEQPD